jgi:DNA-binding transcriptional regulator YiaG
MLPMKEDTEYLRLTGADMLELRTSLGETQAQFAKHFGIGRTTIIGWEVRGPPHNGPAARWIRLVFARLKKVVP